MAFEYDVAVIGGGPGGYVAAIRAAQEGKKTCLFECGSLGGTCLNVGCIPTKALIKSAEVYETVRSAAKFGVKGVDPASVSMDMSAMQTRKEQVVKQLVGGVKGLLAGNGVKIITARAGFVDPHTLEADGKKYAAENIIIATGSSAVIPGFIAQEGTNHIYTSTEMLDIRELPGSVVVIGGGVIGVEFAYLLNKLGVKVTVVELMEHILPMVDAEIADMAKKRMEKDGVTFHMGARVQKIKDDHVFFEKDGKTLDVAGDLVLMAVGRAPNTEGLNAEKIGLEFDKKALKCDLHQRTNIPHIYAIGDVNGKAMLAHTGYGEAEVAVDCICGHEREMDYGKIPSCIYTGPEIACVGMTEAQAREKYGDGIKVGRFPAMANGKSLVEGDTDGMFKVIVDSKYGEILGAHLYGQHVTEMIVEIAAAMTAEATAEEIIQTIHPHPSVSESISEMFRAAWYGKAVHC